MLLRALLAHLPLFAGWSTIRLVRLGLCCCLLWCGLPRPARAQTPAPRVVTSDLARFWQAYDSLSTTTDSVRQQACLQRLYIDPGSPGLHAFMTAKGYTAPAWVRSIRRYPKFWRSLRPRTQLLQAGVPGLQPYLEKLQKLYPALRPASIYLTVGILRSGGTTQGDAVIIGAELAAGNGSVEVSEFAPAMRQYLTRAFARDPIQHLPAVCVHEYVHTQENHYGNNVLGQAIYEGTCDFVTEQVVGQPVALPYRQYGPAHETDLKQRFQWELFHPRFDRWFYNQLADDSTHIADLGYYMGYAICRAYYQQVANQQQAIREMIELDYTSDQAVEAFLTRSRYYFPATIAQLRTAYDAQRPVVTGVQPLPAAPHRVAPNVRELTITFSQPMSPYTSMDYGPGGAATWPLVGRGVFSADRKSVTYQVKLLPAHTYEFVLTAGGFQSTQGYPLRPHRVHFSTSK
ncbi:hypothetical protein [Hymenobacter volaticus]|uniref:DUF2268 domain-containing protein n=1 Tax=Hymenobacter volaticus TaxID=2932254 RepID=A0ABY4GEF5_9BACT|nr:hypothetical protein [Hymenobacter volaticus]UOQ69233.1 hypothetical protein MUN86_27660 [Hymenobacter volaticus]